MSGFGWQTLRVWLGGRAWLVEHAVAAWVQIDAVQLQFFVKMRSRHEALELGHAPFCCTSLKPCDSPRLRRVAVDPRQRGENAGRSIIAVVISGTEACSWPLKRMRPVGSTAKVRGLPMSWKSTEKTSGGGDLRGPAGSSHDARVLEERVTPPGENSGGCSQPLERFDLGQDFGRSRPLFIEQVEAAYRDAGRGRSSTNSLANALGADFVNVRGVGADGARPRFRGRRRSKPSVVAKTPPRASNAQAVFP